MRCTALLLASLSCQIPKKGKPVCGTNGVSYINRKALKCHNQENPTKIVRIAYNGRCIRPEIPECNYTSRSYPVCGSDRLTYLNAPMVACKNKLRPKKQIKIVKKGPCSGGKKHGITCAETNCKCCLHFTSMQQSVLKYTHGNDKILSIINSSTPLIP